MDYSELSLFHDIANQEVDAMIRCFHMRRSHYTPGQTICTYGEGGGEVGVLLRGRADLVRYDYGGTRTILERIETGGVFGEVLAFTPELGDCVEVVSGSESEALFMEYSHIMKRCENACAHHSKLVQNMFRLVTEQTRRLSQRVRSSAAGASGTSSCAGSSCGGWRPAPTASPCPSPSAPWRTTSARTAAP